MAWQPDKLDLLPCIPTTSAQTAPLSQLDDYSNFRLRRNLLPRPEAAQVCHSTIPLGRWLITSRPALRPFSATRSIDSGLVSFKATTGSSMHLTNAYKVPMPYRSRRCSAVIRIWISVMVITKRAEIRPTKAGDCRSIEAVAHIAG